ncbi:hypothetical protein EYF80_040056 [Liparis tanakae]|uniref:Uncharacterized protein n=1 Tax=Liparis tanakae TaxID=230148 RepID=A0A4Z2GAE3_9TELE|nr:hypothetical protein EYF80_040056 [Liparis tanakae]
MPWRQILTYETRGYRITGEDGSPDALDVTAEKEGPVLHVPPPASRSDGLLQASLRLRALSNRNKPKSTVPVTGAGALGMKVSVRRAVQEEEFSSPASAPITKALHQAAAPSPSLVSRASNHRLYLLRFHSQ